MGAHPLVGVDADFAAEDRLDRLVLPLSADPDVVFAGLVDLCVSRFCDSSVITFTADGDAYVVIEPAGDTGPHLAPDPHGGTGPRELRFPFGHDDETTDTHVHGVAVFSWRERSATPLECLMLRLLVEQALRTLAWQRCERRTREATTKAVNLEAALLSSRDIGAAIGILMSRHKATQDHAFELLQQASQRTHRKVRDLALEVVETGLLDPSTLRRAGSGDQP